MAAEYIVKKAEEEAKARAPKCKRCGAPVLNDDPKAAVMVLHGRNGEVYFNAVQSPPMCDECRKPREESSAYPGRPLTKPSR